MDYQSLDLSDHSQVYNYLTSLNLVLSNPQDQIEFQVQLDQLDAIFKSLEESDKQEQKHGSLAVSKMLARNLVVVLSELPLKVYDYTNGLLNSCCVFDGCYNPSHRHIRVFSRFVNVLDQF